jgi:hypothetical protein
VASPLQDGVFVPVAYAKQLPQEGNFVNWYLLWSYARGTDPTPEQLSDEAWFYLTIYVNYPKNCFPLLIYEVPLHNIIVGVWCAMSATKIIHPIFC